MNHSKKGINVSQLSQLKQQIIALSESAEKTSAGLQNFGSNFNSQIQTVSATIGGSSQGKDREVIQSLQQAAKAVQEATQALGIAARTAKSYGSSL